MEGLDSDFMRGFEPFQLASTSMPMIIEVGRSGTEENFFNISGISPGHGVKS